MDFTFSAEARRFGAEVEEWLADNLDPHWEERFTPTSPEWIAFQADWDRKLYARGWSAIYWPTEYGGMGADLEHRAVFSRAMAEAGAPDGLGKVGKRLLSPVLLRHGTPEQKERFLPPILRGEQFWCQGFSEPGAGSDLASLSTRGEVDGDELVITGQKIWTSHAHYTDWVFALVRTSQETKKQAGITFVLLPLNTPGVEVRPLRQINGRTEFAEVFFDGARASMDNVIGEVGDGWRIAKALLDFERGAEMSMARSATIRTATRAAIDDLGTADELGRDVARRLGLAAAGCLGAEVNTLRLLGAQMSGGEPGALSALVKLQQSEFWRATSADNIRDLGTKAFQGTHNHFDKYLSARYGTIASGTSEIQRDIIAARVLNLPN